MVTPNDYMSEYDYACERIGEIEAVHIGSTEYPMTDELIVEYRKLKARVAQIEYEWAVEDDNLR